MFKLDLCCKTVFVFADKYETAAFPGHGIIVLKDVDSKRVQSVKVIGVDKYLIKIFTTFG
jgi:hypothetical protein